MTSSADYVKIVEWSQEDGCFVGSAPGLFFGGCHGREEEVVFHELCVRVEEILELYRAENRPLPAPTAGRDFANRLNEVA